MRPIEKYIKNAPPKSQCKQTSVNIETKHYVFIVEHGINLSAMVRDMLNEAIAKALKLKT